MLGGLASATSSVAGFGVRILKLAMEPESLIAVIRLLHLVVLVFLVLGVGGGETGIDVLWDNVALLALACFHAGDIGLFQRPILVEGAADEVGAVG